MFKKESHVELSDGGTCILSNANCPLNEQQAEDLGIIVKVDEDRSVPCCTCKGYLTSDEVNITCPNYKSYTASEKGIFYNCDYENLI